MSDAAELKKLVKQLQSTLSQEELVDVLKILKKVDHVTEAVLRESRVGLAVGKLRSHASKDVSELAKEIVKKWKTAVDKEKAKHGSSSGTKGAQGGKPNERKGSVASPETPSMKTGSPTRPEIRTAKSDGVKSDMGDNTRDKCVELLYDALASDATAPNDLIFRRAKDIESAVYKDQGSTNANYKSKIRSLMVNLKDKLNPNLRGRVVSGELPAERLPTLTSAEMASQVRRKADEEIAEKNLFKSLAAAEREAETDGFQCSRCKMRKCTYRQAQTRSADEPMTTFVTCTNCGNRWKFS